MCDLVAAVLRTACGGACEGAEGRYSSSVGDLRRGGGELEEEVVINLEDEPRRVSSTSVAAVSTSSLSRVNHRAKGQGGPSEDFVLDIHDEDPRTTARVARAARFSRSKVKRNVEEEITLTLNDDDGADSALANQNLRQNSIPDIVVSQNADDEPFDPDVTRVYDDYDEDIIIEDLRTGSRSVVADSRKPKGIGGRVKDRLFPNRHLPKKKKMNRAQKVEQYVDSLVVEDEHGRVTPVFEREEDLTHDDFEQKRKDLLQRKPKNFIEGEEEIIALDFPSTSGSQMPSTAAEEKRKGGPRKGGDKRTTMRLEGIEEEVIERSSVVEAQTRPETILSPEGYEDYIGDALEDDYPELAGTTDASLDSQQLQIQQLQIEQQLIQQQEIEQQQIQEQEEQAFEEEQRQAQLLYEEYQLQQAAPTGPLSGSESMCFMDDHSPTSNGNCDYYHRCVAKCPHERAKASRGGESVVTVSVVDRDPDASEIACRTIDDDNVTCRTMPDIQEVTCRTIPNSPEVTRRTFPDNAEVSCRTIPEVNSGVTTNALCDNNVLNNNESMNSFATQFRTSCVASGVTENVSNEKQVRTSVSSSTSASADDSRNSSTSASEHSSMSISTGSVSSNVSSVNRNKTRLFLPTSTTSLPEISVEPPTPQAPKPKDTFDRENKIKYDLKVPGYRSMFLTVPGFEDDDAERFLPRYSLDSDDEDDVEESSSEDDDVVHKPRVLSSLAGVAESRGLKRYGSSCDISRFEQSDGDYDRSNDFNGNVEAFGRTSKVGGTGSGAFVAGKLAMFEKVNEEEYQKYIECQEVRKRVFRPPRKSGEYIEKFYSPQVIDTVDARATERSRSLRYYDDEYDSYDNPRSQASPTPERSPTPVRAYSPAVQAASSRAHTEYITTNSDAKSMLSGCSSNVYASPCKTPRTPSPTQDYGYSDFDYNTYDYVGDRQRTPTPTNDFSDVLRDSPALQTSYDYAGTSRASTPDASAAPPAVADNLEQQTDEAMEMLDSSYLDDVIDDFATNSHFDDEVPGKMERGHTSAEYSSYEPEVRVVRSPSPPQDFIDPLDDVFEIEDFDNQGSMTSLGGAVRNKKKAPPPPPTAGPSTSDGKRMGGFFGRVKREKDKDKDKDKEKKTKEKKEKKKEDKPAGKRFQLFGGVKKTGEPSAAEDTPTKSPKKDKGKRRLFGRAGAKENFVGRPNLASHRSDPQATVPRLCNGREDDWRFL
ncbi:uncharacterized protein LOC125033281 [Penaeus chinensis]|uniref:uncharacterized protein LOC125033281 n=1 Tax=Penaeus chinensis TaxID=139456 RepID=UPI001FB6F277|nr:uncharacterized protein LOC125033281 [Penaeus chinensis]